MKLRALAILGVLAAVGCGGNPSGIVQFKGNTPNTALEKDKRGVVTSCGACGQPVELGAAKCANPKCKSKLKWASDFPCAFCGGTGVCRACFMMDQKAGACFNCKGDGFITFQGKTRDCGACKATKKCAICKGTGACDFCAGNKKVQPDKVKELAKKSAETPEDEKDKAPEEKKP